MLGPKLPSLLRPALNAALSQNARRTVFNRVLLAPTNGNGNNSTGQGSILNKATSPQPLSSATGTSKRLFSTEAASTTASVFESTPEKSDTTDVASTDNDFGGDVSNIKLSPVRRSIEEVQAEYDAAVEAGALTRDQYHDFLKKFGDARDFVGAKHVFSHLKAAGFRPNSTSYSLLLLAGRRTLRSDELRAIFGEELSRETGRRGVADGPAIQSPFFEELNQIMTEMKADDIRPEPWFYEDFALNMSAINQAGVLINVASKLEREHYPLTNKFYNVMIRCLSHNGLTDRAEQLWSRMLMNGSATYATYVTRLGALVYLRRFDEADRLFEQIRNQFKLNEIAYNIMLHGLLRTRREQEAFELFARMKSDSDMMPNAITFNTFLTYFWETGNLAGAEPVITYFREQGYPKATPEFSMLIRLYSRYDPAQVSELLKSIKKQGLQFDTAIYNAILSVLVDRRVLPDWKNTIVAALIQDSSASAQPGSLAEACLNLPSSVRNVVARMEEEGVRPNGNTYDLIMRSQLIQRDYNGIRMLYQRISTNKINPLNNHRNHLLTALLGIRDTDGAQQLIKSMRGLRIPINVRNIGLLKDMGLEPPMSFSDGSRQNNIQFGQPAQYAKQPFSKPPLSEYDGN